MNTKVSAHSFGPKDQQKINRAFAFLKEHFSDMGRRSGEDYATHSMEVAQTLLEAVPDPKLQLIALMHDLLLHPNGEELLKKAPLTPKEKELIPKLDSLRRLHIDVSTEDLDHVIQVFTADSRLFLIRMAHRLNDVRNLNRFSQPLQKAMAEETLYMYTALAGRLGLHKWRYEMEDICFKFLFPKESQNLTKHFEEYKKSDELCLKHAKSFLETTFKKQGIHSEIVFRIKNLYSTYRKMALKKRKFQDLTDRLALRVLVKSREDCYRVLGVVHERMQPIPGKIKDYIGSPKENGYQSIHTVVYPLPGVFERPIEIQIRTHEMDTECKYGLAAHHSYKKEMYSARKDVSLQKSLFRSLELLKAETREPKEFAQALRSYFRGGKIIVFNDLEQMFHLPLKSTALDFACITIPDKLVYIQYVKVNGRKHWLDTVLQDGDMIEFSFSESCNLESSWMKCVYTRMAKKNLKELLEQKS